MRPYMRLCTIMACSIVAVATHALPANAALYRDESYATGNWGQDTVTVRVIWDTATVDSDSIYYFNPDSPPPSQESISLIMNGEVRRLQFCTVTRQDRVCQLNSSEPNYGGTQSYYTRVTFAALSQQYLSPTVYV